MLWAERTWAELPADLAACAQAAILPIGATEQHGPHMGVGMDAVLADRLCAGVAAQTGVPMLPVLPYGCSLGHSRRWPGTIPVQPATLMQLVKEIGDGAYWSGVRRLFIVNTHVTNAAPLRCALEMLRATHDDLMVALFNSAELSGRVREFHFTDADDWHANDAETSLMLAVAPDMVDPICCTMPTTRTALGRWCSRIRSTAPAGTASPARRAAPRQPRAGNGSTGWSRT
jgi:creatinine amidohydrolase